MGWPDNLITSKDWKFKLKTKCIAVEFEENQIQIIFMNKFAVTGLYKVILPIRADQGWIGLREAHLTPHPLKSKEIKNNF